MKIGIVGAGIVGGSLKRWLETNTKHDLKVYDPGLGRTDDLSDCDACFISVPVPTKSLKQDLSILEESIRRCPESVIVFVRSSVLPGTCDKLGSKHKRMICAMPEFLTERQADQDMEKLGVLCGVYSDMPELSNNIKLIVSACLPGKGVKVVKNTEAELAKYVHNCYGAMKVTYFNGVHALCERLGVSYDKVLGAAQMTGFIEPTHTMVPGPDGKKGFGGKCFPKDLVAFMGHLGARDLGILMRDVFLLNRIYRGEKDFEDGADDITTRVNNVDTKFC